MFDEQKWEKGKPPQGDSEARLQALQEACSRINNRGDQAFLRKMDWLGTPFSQQDRDYLDKLYFKVIENTYFNAGTYSTPVEPCPYCGTLCDADWVDVGVGLVQCGPYHCDCGASEIGPHDTPRQLTEAEADTGWYEPGEPPGSSANVVDGKIVDWKTAQEVYKACYPLSATEEGRAMIRGVSS